MVFTQTVRTLRSATSSITQPCTRSVPRTVFAAQPSRRWISVSTARAAEGDSKINPLSFIGHTTRAATPPNQRSRSGSASGRPINPVWLGNKTANLAPPADAYPHPQPDASSIARTSGSSSSSTTTSAVAAEDDFNVEFQRKKQTYTLAVKSSNNNCIFNLLDPTGRTVFRTSPGLHGYTKFNRSTYEAAHKCAVASVHAFEECLGREAESGRLDIKLCLTFNGFGQGREAATAVLQSGEGIEARKRISTLKDITPIRVGGVRPRKVKRL